MVAGLNNFITSLDKLMASQPVFIAISRICIIGLGLLGVLPIGTTTKQKTNQVANKLLHKQCICTLLIPRNAWLKEEINYYMDTNNYLTDKIKQ